MLVIRQICLINCLGSEKPHVQYCVAINRSKPVTVVVCSVVASLLLIVKAPSASAAPQRCVDAMYELTMLFDEFDPTYTVGDIVNSVTYCRMNDWMALARSRVSRFRTMDDYNYYREPALALKGENLNRKRVWMCGRAHYYRAEGRYWARGPFLACKKR